MQVDGFLTFNSIGYVDFYNNTQQAISNIQTTPEILTLSDEDESYLENNLWENQVVDSEKKHFNITVNSWGNKSTVAIFRRKISDCTTEEILGRSKQFKATMTPFGKGYIGRNIDGKLLIHRVRSNDS